MSKSKAKASFTFRTDQELRDMLKKHAADLGVSVGAVINIALSEKFRKRQDVESNT